MPDRIEETLSKLRVDVDRTALPDSRSVRRRGDRRTRNQVVGSAVGVAAVVAGLVGVGGDLVGTDRSVAPPATRAPSVSTTPDSGPPTLDPPVTEVPQSVLLTADDLGVGRLAEDNVNAVGIETLTGGCLLGSDDLVDGAFAAYGANPDGKPVAALSVLTQESSADAARQLEDFRSGVIGLDACQARLAEQPGQPDQTTVTAVDLTPAQSDQLVALGEGAWAYRVEAPQFTSVVLGLRTANASAVLSVDAQDFRVDQALGAAATARERMRTVFGA